MPEVPITNHPGIAAPGSLIGTHMIAGEDQDIIKWAGSICTYMSEVRSWDTVFFVKTLNQNIGIRVYYDVDREKCAIRYDGHAKEFGVTATEYSDNPKKGDTTTYSYGFKVVAGQPYVREEEGGKKFGCMDIRVDAVQNTQIKNSEICSTYSEFLDDGKQHHTTVRVECGSSSSSSS